MTSSPFTVGEGERRVCTIAFCDLQGSTAIAERLDPEEWAEIVNEALAAIVAPVARYEGTVARLLGDAVLAYFGAPVAHEDDPERAVLAALDMIRACGVLGERLGERGVPRLAVRVGINTGTVVLQDVRAGAAIEHTALGDVANVAARLQSIAEPGTIVVSDQTHRHIADAFAFRSLGAVELKGRTAPVGAFVVTGRADRPVVAPRRSGPLVGRDREIAVLRAAATDVRAGRGRVVALVGEAGIGKTRLIRELEAYWHGSERSDDHAHWSESRGESFSQALPYRLLQPHLLEMCGASEGDPPDVVRAKLRAGDETCCPGGACSIVEAIQAGPAARRELSLRALEVVLAVEEDANAGPAGEELSAEIERVVVDAVRRHHEHGAGILVFDDLQWSDIASAEMVRRIAALTEEAPIVVVLAFRPERGSPAWSLRQSLETELPRCYEEIALGPLSDDVAATLVTGLLDGTALSPKLTARILEKAEGNPLFLEEIVRSLIDSGALARASEGAVAERPEGLINVPETLRALLAARIDRLEQGPRRVAQIASVIGRTFTYSVLKSVVTDDALERQLTALERLDVVREEARMPERLYAFRHPLLQVDEQAGIIGQHLAEAGDPEALRFLLLAADRAIRLHTLDDALAVLARAAAVAKAASPDRAGLLALLEKRGRVHELRAEYEDALRTYDELAREGDARNDAGLRAEALSRQANVYTMPTRLHDPERAKTLVAEAVSLAREAGEEELLARLQWSRAFGALWAGEFDAALEAGEESLRLARALGLRDLEASALNTLGHVRRERGDLAGSIRAMAEAAELFRSLDDLPMTIDSLSILAYERYLDGDGAGALTDAREAFALAERISHDFGRVDSAYPIGVMRYQAGDYGQAIEIWETAVAAAKRAGHVGGHISLVASLVPAYLEVGAPERARAALDGVDADASASGLGPWLLGAKASLAIAEGRIDDARRLAAEADGIRTPFWVFVVHQAKLAAARAALAAAEPEAAAEIARTWIEELARNGARLEVAELEWLQGEAWRRAGRTADAAPLLERARDRAAADGYDRVRWHALRSLGLVRRSLGEAAAAQQAFEAAAAILDRIEALLPPDLARTFRSLPDVADARRDAGAASAIG